MVKKLLYKIDTHDSYDNNINNDNTRFQLLKEANDKLHDHLVYYKNMISHHHMSKKWDKYKKLTNDYELVFTTTQGYPSIAMRSPISRSYFKLWEIMHDLNLILDCKKPLRAAFLADAPGGFVEAFVDYRTHKCPEVTDELFGVSLKATHRIIPQWKLSQDFCKKNNITVLFGKNGTGDLCDLTVIDDFCDCARTCDFVTADGGFDFSSDFNGQEEMSTKLIMCEIYAALRLMSQGGTFVLKIFDIHNTTTVGLLFVLSLFFDSMSFVKPLSSRPANSEKYIVCTGYNTQRSTQNKHVLELIREAIDSSDQSILSRINTTVPFFAAILEFNYVYIAHQVLYIHKTIEMITNSKESDVMNKVKKQVKKAIKWCHKYNVQISVDTLKGYKPLFQSVLSTDGLTKESNNF